MRIGVFTALFQQFPLEVALDKAVAAGVTAVEIGAGGYPGSQHCRPADLLDDERARAAFQEAIAARGLLLSALSVHNNPLHPDPAVAQTADAELRAAIRLAEALGVPVVNGFAGLPAGAPGDTSPNWVTCPWPPDFLRMLDYQWNEVAIPYWRELETFAAGHNVRVAFEMHPGMLVYNVETLLRLRAATGPALGCNFDPSHL
ncbi:MAG TPA: sugar phosphate isomerase/epimerase, partial [Promineifilum sp.]|nr:sugar phosphate isomerase/epimerase [Promineifilum sp.]